MISAVKYMPVIIDVISVRPHHLAPSQIHFRRQRCRAPNKRLGVWQTPVAERFYCASIATQQTPSAPFQLTQIAIRSGRSSYYLAKNDALQSHSAERPFSSLTNSTKQDIRNRSSRLKHRSQPQDCCRRRWSGRHSNQPPTA
jgi:hypothetical protein